MKDRPILFSGEMVMAILEGRKTQTRRVVKKIPCECGGWLPYEVSNTTPEGWQTIGHSGKWTCESCLNGPVKCPYGQPGDRLWVRETFSKGHPIDISHQYSGIRYRADGAVKDNGNEIGFLETTWTPSIFMPRWASRITLEVFNVGVERVQDIMWDEAIAEGIRVLPLQDANDPSAWWESAPGENQARTPVWSFKKLWDSINGKKHPWESNPWVWVIEFKKLEVNYAR